MEYLVSTYQPKPYNKLTIGEEGKILMSMKPTNSVIHIKAFDIMQRADSMPFATDHTEKNKKTVYFLRFVKGSELFGQMSNANIVAVWEFENETLRDEAYKKIINLLPNVVQI